MSRAVEQFTGGANRLDDLIDLLDRRRGVVLSSGTTVPGRYESFDLGFSDPPLRLETTGSDFTLQALNARGEVLIAFLGDTLREPCVVITEKTATRLAGHILRGDAPVEEDQRTRRASVMSLVRDLVAAFGANDDPLLGLFGAFAYDLVFQIEDLVQKRARERDQRDIVLYVPDRLLAYDRATGRGVVLSYDFAWKGRSTEGLPRDTAESVYAKTPRQGFADHAPGEYQATVETARAAFARGDLFEAVPGQLFAEPCERSPAEVFQRLCRINPSPYGALMNLGDGEFLVSASPEMFVRSDGRRVETCPISGTIARGVDAIGDAEQIRQLLNSRKGRVRAQHVHRRRPQRQGAGLRARHHQGAGAAADRDLFEAVSHRRSCRGHAAAGLRLARCVPDPCLGGDRDRRAETVGDAVRRGPRALVAALVCRRDRRVNFDGSINTGLTIRTIRMKDGLAEVRVGATCLFDSDPAAEDRECQVKAAALFQALRGDPPKPLSAFAPDATGCGKRVLLIDHDDSFVHMLADYFRQVGASVTRGPLRACARDARAAQLGSAGAVAGAGPAGGFRHCRRPSTRRWRRSCRSSASVSACRRSANISAASSASSAQPAHGRPSRVQVRGGRLMQNLPDEIVIGRYHSLYVERDSMPDVLDVTASTEDGVAMAIEHKTLPVGGVQFHPESLMSLGGEVGLRIVENAFRLGAAIEASLRAKRSNPPQDGLLSHAPQ